jgi:hypothetical protein
VLGLIHAFAAHVAGGTRYSISAFAGCMQTAADPGRTAGLPDSRKASSLRSTELTAFTLHDDRCLAGVLQMATTQADLEILCGGWDDEAASRRGAVTMALCALGDTGGQSH